MMLDFTNLDNICEYFCNVIVVLDTNERQYITSKGNALFAVKHSFPNKKKDKK